MGRLAIQLTDVAHAGFVVGRGPRHHLEPGDHRGRANMLAEVGDQGLTISRDQGLRLRKGNPAWLARLLRRPLQSARRQKATVVGLGDDIMVVAVGGKTTPSTFWPSSKLNGTRFWPDGRPKDARKVDGQGMRFPPGAGDRHAGESLELRKGQAARIQIAFG